MARQASVSFEQNFANGLITQATGLNFPENAATETYNCIFKETGLVSRRPQFDFEDNYVTESFNRSGKAVNTFLWKGSSALGDFSIVVVQIGTDLFFYDSDFEDSLSGGFFSSSSIDMSSYATDTNPQIQDCTFAVGLGYLFVFHPSIKPLYISYDYAARSFAANAINIQIRDQAGISDSLTVDNRPLTLSDAHKYNLLNQGWGAKITKADAVTFTNGSPNVGWPNHFLSVGGILYFTTAGTLPTNFSANTTYYVASVVDKDTITVAATASGSAISAGSAGSGTHTGNTYNPLLTWDVLRSDYPSNADVWWDFKDEKDNLNLNYVSSVSRGTTPASKGSFILDLFDQQRDSVSGISGLADKTYTERPAIGAFFAGRVWYTNIGHGDLSNKILYSQIIEDTSQFGKCYQNGDPTAEFDSVLLATDGGVITVPNMGVVYRLEQLGNHLIIFASNGVWSITGSEGIGFTAIDYTITYLSEVRSISSTNFVKVENGVFWWNLDGVYTIQPAQNGSFVVQNISAQRIKDFFSTIPVLCKKQARVTYNPLTNIVQWIYRSTVNDTFDEIFEFDSVLNLNVLSGAFYPWTISVSGDVGVFGVITANVSGQSRFQALNVVSSTPDNVVDSSSNQVVAYNYTAYSSAITTTKFLCGYGSISAKNITWAEVSVFTPPNDYMDWFKYDSVGINYESYFVSGYKLRGQGAVKFQSNYLNIFSYTEKESPVEFFVQGRWDYSLLGDAGRWTNQQKVSLPTSDYSYQRRRLKIRGRGVTVQFKFSSIPGQPFNVSGWSVWETAATGV